MQISKQSFVCLAVSHLVKDCSLKIKCFKCSKWHHVALCDSEEKYHSSNNSSIVTNIAGVDGNTKIFFQNAKVKAKNCKNSHANSVGVLFESFSQ